MEGCSCREGKYGVMRHLVLSKRQPLLSSLIVENEIVNHAKASKNLDLDRALNRPVSGLLFCLLNKEKYRDVDGRLIESYL